MSEWAIKMVIFLSFVWLYCFVQMIRHPVNSPKERLYMGLAITSAILMYGCTHL